MATPSKSKEFAFNGRLRTNVDGASIGPNDFQVLKNLRPTEANVRGIAGMTKINTSPLASTGIRNGFHFKKSLPVEYHVLAWTSDGKVWVNNTAAPNQGAFDGTALFTDTAGGTTGRFSNAPGGALAYANGKEACLWGGTEHRCSGFIDYPATGQIYDYSDLITNTKTDTQNIATIHTSSSPTVDSNTMLLLHCDGADASTTFTDSSPTTPHTVTAVGDAKLSTAQKAFGTASGIFDGTGDYLTVPDNADFNFSATGSDGKATIEFLIGRSGSTCWGLGTYFSQAKAGAGTDYIRLYRNVAKIQFDLVIASSVVATMSVNATGPSSAPFAFRHLALTMNKVSTTYYYYLFADGQLVASTTHTAPPGDYDRPVCIGAFDNGTTITDVIGTGTTTYLDEIRVSDIARWTSSFSPPTYAYGSGYASTSYIGSIMPLDGMKFYVVTPNAQTATMAMSEWNGNAWSALTIIADNTLSGGKTLYQTGTVTWASTAATSKPTQIEKVYLYWYKMVVSGAADFGGITLSQATVSIPFQAIKDIWDGEERPADSVMGYKSSVYYDYTSNVLDNSYTSTGTTADASSYAALGGYTSSDYVYVGSIERLSGFMVSLIDANVNTNASILSVSYWDGTAWVALTIQDGTLNGTNTFGKSGWITWSAQNRAGEFKRSDLGGGKTTDSLYFYRIGFSATLSTTVNMYHIGGIPAPKDIRGYAFPVLHQNRTVLISNTDGLKNSILMSSMDYPNSFNGLDSYEYSFGSDDAINAASSLFLRFGSSVQDMLVLTKQGEIHLLEGNGSDSDPYRRRLLSEKIGCRAPLTMTTVPVGDLGGGIRRQLAIWESQRGIEVFDGATLMDPLLSYDISDKFDPVNANYAGSSLNTGFYDPVYDEYHWCPVGTTEWIYTFKYKKWYQADRGTAKYLYGGIPVMDTSGNSYIYGFDNAGYVYRLENGTTFDGNAIAHTLRAGDMAFPEGSIMEYSQVQWFMLIAKAKTITTQNVSMVYYNDTQTASYGTTTISPLRSGYRLINQVVQNQDIQTTFHGFEFSISTNDEVIGFEPLYLGIRYTIFPRQLS